MKRLFFPSITSLAPNNLKASSKIYSNPKIIIYQTYTSIPQPSFNLQKKQNKTKPPRKTKHIQSETNQDRHPA